MNKKTVFQFILQCVVTVAIAYGTASLIQRYFFSSKEDGTQLAVQRGQSFTAPESVQVRKPINREIDFLDTPCSAQEVETTIQAQWGSVTFSTDGASLQRFEVHRELDRKASSITTIFPAAPDERESRCFLVALDHSTPYFYQLDRVTQDEHKAELTYSASFAHGMIIKTFVVHKNKYQIDVALMLQTHADHPTQVRMLYPAPHMRDLATQDVITGFVLEESKVKRFTQSDIPVNKGWRNPTLFGASDRYFVNALTKDEQNMIEKAYFWPTPDKKLLCCLESNEITDKAEWQWSFYLGPKDTDDVRVVDPRLEELVEYSGWFGPISVLMLKFLKFIYGYVHNFGIAIIILTLLMRLAMVPLTFSSKKQEKKRAEMDKQLKLLQQKYKTNPERLQQERMNLVRKHGFGGLGCLMPFLQIPFFFALNRLLSSSIELYKAPFIPGWITDLSAPDPYYILPALFAVGMILTSFQMPKDQRSTFMIMGVGGAVFFANFAAGLLLFFVVSVFAGLLSTYAIKKFKLA